MFFLHKINYKVRRIHFTDIKRMVIATSTKALGKGEIITKAI
jgi:hypothetical protein